MIDTNKNKDELLRRLRSEEGFDNFINAKGHWNDIELEEENASLKVRIINLEGKIEDIEKSNDKKQKSIDWYYEQLEQSKKDSECFESLYMKYKLKSEVFNQYLVYLKENRVLFFMFNALLKMRSLLPRITWNYKTKTISIKLNTLKTFNKINRVVQYEMEVDIND